MTTDTLLASWITRNCLAGFWISIVGKMCTLNEFGFLKFTDATQLFDIVDVVYGGSHHRWFE
jgi:hypothetical protein